VIKRAKKKFCRIIKRFLDIIFNENKYLIFEAYQSRSYTPPIPEFIKHAYILKNSIEGSTFIETGTYYGETTKFLIKNGSFKKIITIEPDKQLFYLAQNLFLNNHLVSILNLTSEEFFPDFLPTLKGDVTYFLDGHYSEGVTFQGSKDTPIYIELETIAKNLKNQGKVSIMIDDFHTFNPSVGKFKDYPTNSFLVKWADTNQLNWFVHNDIFIANNIL
jgi:hypothetical protein